MAFMKTMSKRLPVVLSEGEDGWIIATCPVIPGCTTQGKSRDEALANAREAIQLCLEEHKKEGWEVPLRYELVDIDVAGMNA